jgi:hypothetical protein
VNRFDERFKERSVPATGPRLLADMVVKELSARDKYFNLCHFAGGRTFKLSKLEELSLRCGWTEYSLEIELPEPDLFTLEE